MVMRFVLWMIKDFVSYLRLIQKEINCWTGTLQKINQENEWTNEWQISLSGETCLKYRVFIEETEYGSNLPYIYISFGYMTPNVWSKSCLPSQVFVQFIWNLCSTDVAWFYFLVYMSGTSTWYLYILETGCLFYYCIL